MIQCKKGFFWQFKIYHNLGYRDLFSIELESVLMVRFFQLKSEILTLSKKITIKNENITIALVLDGVLQTR